MSITDRFKSAWNAFSSRDPTYNSPTHSNTGFFGYGGSFFRPDRRAITYESKGSIVTALYNRIALDVSAMNMSHVRVDENDYFIETINSGLNNCLTMEANIDQTGREFIQEAVMIMLEQGTVALVPVETDRDPKNGSFDVISMRTGKVLEWYPRHVKLEVYNDLKGIKETIVMAKTEVWLVENPFYSVLNESNSTMQRLIRKLSLLDAVDEQSGSGKLDMIVQLPYMLKTDRQKEQARRRRGEIEDQLTNSKYGIAYTDGTEKVIQLNRSLDNNLQVQVEYLTSMLYGQLGMTPEILNGTADSATMQNYLNRTIAVIAQAIVDEGKRKSLTKTARSQGQSIKFFNDPFKLVPVEKISEMADKLTRNEILTPNEFRQIIGKKPSKDPAADELRNRNINQVKDVVAANRENRLEEEYDDAYDEGDYIDEVRINDIS